MAEEARRGAISPEPDFADQARLALKRVLASKEFRASHRCQDFLRYVVEATLAGQGGTLKERTIGIEAFGRPADYDPSDDASVRVKAGEVRRRLELHYAGEGREDAWRIELPPGTYVPEFHRVEAAPAQPAPRGAAHRPGAFASWKWALLAAVLIAGGGMASHWLWPAQIRAATSAWATGSVMDRFWSPVLAGDAPVLLAASYVPVYGPKLPWQQAIASPNDLILLPDQFVGGGDLVATARLAALLSAMHRRYELEIGNEMTFRNLQAAPAILVGYSSTRWRALSNGFRYGFETDHPPFGISDRGRATAWVLRQLTAARHTPEDYAIVSRVLDAETQTMVVEVAGITQYGTEAASALVTNPKLLAAAMQSAPAGWEERNLQIVIHVRVIADTPAAQDVVARYFWPSP